MLDFTLFKWKNVQAGDTFFYVIGFLGIGCIKEGTSDINLGKFLRSISLECYVGKFIRLESMETPIYFLCN